MTRRPTGWPSRTPVGRVLQRQRAAPIRAAIPSRSRRSRWIGIWASRNWCRIPRTSERSQHSTSDYTQYLRATYGYLRLTASIFPAAGRCGLCNLRGQPGKFLPGIPPGVLRPVREIRLERRLVLFAPEREHPGEHLRSDLARPDPELHRRHRRYLLAGARCPNGQIFTAQWIASSTSKSPLFGEVTFKFTDTLKATVGLARLQGRFYRYRRTPAAHSWERRTRGTAASASEKPVTPKGRACRGSRTTRICST